jgi:signal transduction histidine kinase/HAMP domain-containing protein
VRKLGTSPAGNVLGGRLVLRLTVTTSVLIVGTCLVLSVVLVRRHLEDIRHGLLDRGRAIAKFVAREAELGALSGDVDTLRQLGMVALGQPDVAYCRFFDGRHALLASIGEQKDARVAVVSPEDSADSGPDGFDADVWEFQTPITTTAVRPSGEDLLTDGHAQPDRGGSGLARERIGSVSIGIVLTQLHEHRRTAFGTAMAFTLLVAVLAVASAVLLMKGTLRALASAAALADERSRLAELKASFVTQASHEFRTPLAVILACCTALQRFGSRMGPEQQRRRLVKIQGSVRHMTELLDDVLTLGRADSGKLACVPQTVDLDTLCREVVADVQATVTDDRRTILRYDTSRREAVIDGKLVRQILRNLLTNAIKYSPAGGTAWLDVTRTDARIMLRVTDQGIGIPLDDQQAIFEPFHRGANVGKIPGSGLGLAITQKAVALHQGTIDVKSAPGRGTTFIVTLPDGPLPVASVPATLAGGS